ncbi:MAG: 30S ribosomal protein S7 [Candidatus Sericytochromatia bacterium]|nr:MAG: 30S ribosomal protein S7 [Candidatus Sericytochromatia bacterium]
MPRRAKVLKRIPKPDPIYKDVTLAKFINNVMTRGKKSLAESIVYKALDVASEKLKKNQLDIFNTALKNATPLVEVKARRVGGATYQVPSEVKPERGVSLAMRWIISNARKRNGKSMIEKLSAEFVDAFNGVGASVKKKEDTHKMAEANRAFSHYSY